ncbi:MAG: transcription-repair coupling factor [Candidatus Omnitrophica bacterium]|nr:transcription-repair coupling factor [Candidatus Omnitrophota bacterium]
MFKSLKFHKGQEIETQAISGQLVDFGYKRRQSVDEEGDFSIRGHIIDLFPITFELPVRIELEINTISKIYTYAVSTGENIYEHDIIVVLPRKSERKANINIFSEDFPSSNFVDLSVGDYAVHVRHGIGIFKGKEKIKAAEGREEHLVIEYENKERLFVPMQEAHLVQKYLAFGSRRPRLNRLGSKEWLRIKQRAGKGIQKYALDLLHLESMRQLLKGFKFSRDTDWQERFEKTFPFEDTPDQITAAAETKKDMESEKPMDRLICGEVGYGKTEVAMRAAFKAVMDNKQVAMLVPTTILAEQHYYNFCSRLKEFPIRVEMLSRFKTGSQQRGITEGLKDGSVDIVVGTHRLLGDDIHFRDLGLVIIDEEQRFGVKAKEKLKTLRLSVDVLTLTATPIPRTLYMSLMGAKDMSQVNTPPKNRIPVATYVVEYDENLIRQAVLREKKRKGQAYFVHNQVYDIERTLERIKAILPGSIKAAYAHGQMPPKILEKVMLDFIKGGIDVLVCTSIIESGIDIPNVNTIIIDNAEAFGLADLHQLRGRVGRFNRRAYAYLLVSRAASLSGESKKRLAAIEQYSHLGSGFSIAMEDLEIRGAGNILGTEQHGFIMAVGFDLYCRLLRQAVANYKQIT